MGTKSQQLRVTVVRSMKISDAKHLDDHLEEVVVHFAILVQVRRHLTKDEEKVFRSVELLCRLPRLSAEGELGRSIARLAWS